MSSEESDVELDMDLVLAEPDSDEAHEMGDPDKKGRGHFLLTGISLLSK